MAGEARHEYERIKLRIPEIEAKLADPDFVWTAASAAQREKLEAELEQLLRERESLGEHFREGQ